MNFKVFSVLLILGICSVSAVSATSHVDEIFYISDQIIDGPSNDEVAHAFNESEDVVNSTSFAVDNASVSNESSTEVSDSSDDNTTNIAYVSSFGGNAVSFVLSGIGSNLKSSFGHDGDFVKVSYDFFLQNINHILGIFSPTTINFSFENILPKDLGMPWNVKEDTPSIYDRNYDSSLAESLPWTPTI